MQKNIYKTLQEYLCDNNIVVTDNFHNIDFNIKHITEDQILKQLQLIAAFHKKMMGAGSIILEKINNNTGKNLEKYKIQLNMLSRNIEKIKYKTSLTDFDKILLNEGPSILADARKNIEHIYLNKYMDLIVRSMDRGEICLGNTYFNNLTTVQDKIHICSTKKINYNILEMDSYYLLNKLKSKKCNINYEKIIEKYCSLENFDNNSFNFLYSIMQFPYDFVKYSTRYFNSRKEYNTAKYRSKILKTLNLD